MVCLGKRSVKTKDGRDMVIISACGHRLSDGTVYVDQIWTSPRDAEKLQPGDQFRAFRDGGISIMDGLTVDVKFLSDIL